MRRKVIAANWKMNLKINEALTLTAAIMEASASFRHDVILCPPFPYLTAVRDALKGSKITVAAQNCADRENGAFTGEVSAFMLASIEIPHVIIGHSERRIYYHESHEVLKDKVNIALANNLKPIFCCGETKEVRLDERQADYVCRQLEDSIFHLSEDNIQKVIIAYEPIWAIGTGLTATAQQAQEMHHFIRSCVASRYTPQIADQIIIQYGGSVKPDNAKELFSQPDVDGGLIGGASLKAEDFIAIINSI